MGCEDFTSTDFRLLQDVLRAAENAIIKIYGNPSDYIPNGKVWQTYDGIRKIQSELYMVEAENRITADNTERDR